MTLTVHTARISSRDPDRFDITRKSGGEAGRPFAPTWSILSPALEATRNAKAMRSAGNVEGAATVEDIDTIGMSPLSTVVIYDKKTGRTPLYGAHLWDVTINGQAYTRAIVWYDDASVKLIAPGKQTQVARIGAFRQRRHVHPFQQIRMLREA